MKYLSFSLHKQNFFNEEMEGEKSLFSVDN